MWLLYRGSDGELALEKFHSKDVPKYAILSHRWLPEDEEPQFHHLHPRPATPETKRKAGYAKLEFCVSEATRDGFGYSWVDTVCINKSSSSELNEAIVSMFRWYGESAKCYAYLNDVAGKSNLCSSKWFTRGWTLQELIAPKEVEFFSSDRQFIGTKSSLEREIKAVTGIPPEALRGRRLSEFSVPDRISWVKNRETTRAEDQAYCMMGIFNVFMPIIYGEGNQAWNRLLEEVDKKGKAPSQHLQYVQVAGVQNDTDNGHDDDDGNGHDEESDDTDDGASNGHSSNKGCWHDRDGFNGYLDFEPSYKEFTGYGRSGHRKYRRHIARMNGRGIKFLGTTFHDTEVYKALCRECEYHYYEVDKNGKARRRPNNNIPLRFRAE